MAAKETEDNISELTELELTSKASNLSRKHKLSRKVWSDDEVGKLTQLYEQKPSLWDVKSEEYHNREKRNLPPCRNRERDGH